MYDQKLDLLAQREDSLLEKVRRQRGWIKGEQGRVDALGISKQYAEIHSEYVRLALLGNIEALKRAVFIQWYEAAEPGFITGIHDLDKAAREQAFKTVEELCKMGRLDDELKWMLGYYYLIAEFYILRPRKYPCLVKTSMELSSSDQEYPPIDAHLEGRGQMSVYWLSIRASAARRDASPE